MPSKTPAVCAGPVFNRRRFLEVGAVGLGGLGLSDLLQLRAAAGEPDKDTAVIFLWLPGGPPHMDTFDLKPDAPAEYRGPFKPIATNVPGVEICEHLPRMAGIADKYNIVRSCAHEFADHGGGHKRFLTGRIPASPVGFVNDSPAVTSIVGKHLDKRDLGVPNVVMGADDGRAQVDVISFGSAYLGSSFNPYIISGDPSNPSFKVQNLSLAPEMETALGDRRRLLAGFDQLKRTIDRGGLMKSLDELNRRALGILTSDKARNAFDLSREPEALRQRYGMHAWGQRALLARRLVEAGCSFVTMVLENPIPGQPMPHDCTYNWDSHAVNCNVFTDTQRRLPYLDQTMTALIEDVMERGLHKRVMVILTGEFGRTPRIEQVNGRPGRDHWPQAMSMVVAGGGMRGGQVIGSTNSKGEHPKDRPMTPNDLWATVYRHLGVNYDDALIDLAGRPMPILPFGSVIPELLPTV
ncbi:MAG: DUF1501 domain-containing protein [Planctomycetia bacterium]